MFIFCIAIFVGLENFVYISFNVASHKIERFFLMSDKVFHEEKRIEIAQT
jgi:hypothetical protein